MCLRAGLESFRPEQYLAFAVLLSLVAFSIGRAGVDARLLVALTSCFLLRVLEADISNVAHGAVSVFSSLPFLLIITVVATAEVWLLRRQSAPRVRSS